MPILIFLGIILYILMITGELSNPDKIISYQSKNNILYGLAYSNPVKYFKLKNVEYKKPEIISLGTSRVLQFRDFFFKKPGLFYNAGGGVATIKDFNTFINTLQTENLQVVIIGLDQNFFNENWDNLKSLKADYRNNFSIETIVLTQGIQVLKDFFSRKISINTLHSSSRNIGLSAIQYNEGARPDGSDLRTRLFAKHELDFKDCFKRIEEGRRFFQYGRDINSAAVKELDLFLQNCETRNIHVIAFLPPYAHAVWNKMKQKKDSFSYMFKLQEKLEPIFDTYSFDFFDFSDIKKLGATDYETLGGFHGSEKAYLRIFIKMREKCDILKNYADLDRLNELLLNSYSSKEAIHEIY